jgi:ribose/xylose/arabinose/galactoside ABC-type transport system permease subunit
VTFIIMVRGLEQIIYLIESITEDIVYVAEAKDIRHAKPTCGVVPLVLLITIAIVVLLSLMLTQTRYGKCLTAVGQNLDAARLPVYR